ncbi:MaoC/PaaZ C-terminal domain-containing protein [Nocardia nova]|uniref:MaoC/PaaZ C-terminal domain-containing protein n=1 Tax=Nocardia nova TaxID=37330 RepID=UPI0033D8E4DA
MPGPSTRVEFDADSIGARTDPERLAVTRESVTAYAAATNDPIAAHLAGDLAAPLYAAVPVMPLIIEAAFLVAPPEAAIRVLHGEQDIRFHRLIVPGDQITATAQPLGFTGRPNGTAAAICVESRDGVGELVNEQYITLFFPKYDAGVTVGALAPGHKFDETLRAAAPAAVVTHHVDDDQTFRYAEASGDPNPVHTDPETAVASGLPGIIAHGLCSQAMTAWAAVAELAGGDSSRLRRHAVRFTKPVFPGQDIVTTFWRRGSVDGVTSYQFESAVDGVVVLRDGLAEIAD